MSTQMLRSVDSPRLSSDVAVVGTGAGGAAVAGALRRAGADVLMIEAGPALTPTAGRHLRNVESPDSYNDKVMQLLWPADASSQAVPGVPGFRGIRAVGGMMTAWAHMVPRPVLDGEWDGVVPPEELRRHLTDAEALLWATDGLFGAGSARQQWVQRTLASGLATTACRVPLAGRRGDDGRIEYAGADALLEAGDGAAPLRILTGFAARNLMHRDGRASAIEAVDRAGSRVSIEADTFVVGAGVLGTPQLLHSSGFRHPTLGRYLTDHLNVVTRVYLNEDAPPEESGDEPINLMIPVAADRAFHTAILDIPSVAHAGLLADAGPGRTTDIGTFIGTVPSEESRLIFDDTRPDAFGLPAVRADMRLTDLDHAHVSQAMAYQYQVARTIGQPWRGMTPVLRPFGSSLHLMGTHRIGDDENTSVANSHGRLHGSTFGVMPRGLVRRRPRR